MPRRRRIYILGGSFNPPGLHHKRMVESLQEICADNDLIVIIPCGMRPDKERTNDIDPTHRAAMVQLAFTGLRQVQIDLSDLDRDEFSRTWDLDARYRKLFPDADIWHVVGTDLVKGGADQASEMHRTWYRGIELFKHRPFVVVSRGDLEVPEVDFPPNRIVLNAKTVGSSTNIRNLRSERLPIDRLVHPDVQRYIERWHLYTGRNTHGTIDWCPQGPALILAIPPDDGDPSDFVAEVDRLIAQLDA